MNNSMNNTKIIAIGCKSRVGKDTMADYIANNYNCKIVRFAEPLYHAAFAAQSALQLETIKQPYILQGLGEAIRKTYGVDFFANIAEKSIIENLHLGYKYIIIPDLRHRSEYQMLSKFNAICVLINRNDRPLDRDPDHISENDLNPNNMDYIIHNDGTLHEYYTLIDQFLANIS